MLKYNILQYSHEFELLLNKSTKNVLANTKKTGT